MYKSAHGRLKENAAEKAWKYSPWSCLKNGRTPLPEDPSAIEGFEMTKNPMFYCEILRNWFDYPPLASEICDFLGIGDTTEIGRCAHGVARESFHKGRPIAVKTTKLTTMADPIQNPPEMLLMHGINHPSPLQIFRIHFISDPSGTNGLESV